MVSLNFCPPIIAHRGASAFAPENTMAAFTKAVQLGIKWIEFDVMQAACGTPVIFHDDSLERTTNGKGELYQRPYHYLKTLDAGAWFDPVFAGERIPTFAQTMSFLQETKTAANVELKALPGHEEQLILRLLDEMAAYLQSPRATILFSSFSIDALYYLRKRSADCLIGLLMHEWLPDWQTICHDLRCVSVHVNHEILTMESAQQIKAAQKKLLCYTVNEIERAQELYSWGVDAVFSDAIIKI